MNRKLSLTGILRQAYRFASAILITWALLGPGPALIAAQAPAKEPVATPTPAKDPAAAQATTKEPAAEDSKIPPEQLDSLVAPLALYPDNLLAQVLVGATYPLELVQLHQWLAKNKDIAKDQKKLT